jgi:hypothetical protein
MHFSLGVQRQLPGNWLVEADYVGKLGRRLPALGDPAQTLNFKDAASGQFFYNAYGAVQKAVQTGSPIPNQPWFENQMGAALAQYGFTCGTATAALLGTATSCTQLAAAFSGGFFFSDGDASSEIQTLADFNGLSGVVGQGLLLPNVGLLAQNGAAGFIGNYSSSNYNALIIRVNHRLTHDLTMEVNYTYSHSIDNDSVCKTTWLIFPLRKSATSATFEFAGAALILTTGTLWLRILNMGSRSVRESGSATIHRSCSTK